MKLLSAKQLIFEVGEFMLPIIPQTLFPLMMLLLLIEIVI